LSELPDLPRPTWLGRVEYLAALALQRARREAVLAGTAPEAFFLREHDPVYTTGLRAVADLDPAVLGAPLVAVERGGLTTWHGPGQLVGYPIVDVGARDGSVKGTVRAIESGVISWLEAIGVQAGRRDGFPGVWVGADKICAVGLHFRRGVTLHGFALNLAPDLAWFARITPCGITDGGVTSVERIRGAAPAPSEVALDVGEHVLRSLAGCLTPSVGAR
jgi:lipoyl(octanoyl) transferase